MQTSESTKVTPTVQAKATQKEPFFAPAGRQTAGGKVFFGGSDGSGNGFFKPGVQPAPVQAKLSIGAPGDKYEQEADRMAERVVSQPAVQRQELPEEKEKINRKPLAAEIIPLVQRKEEEEKEPKALQRKAFDEEPEEDLQRQTKEPEEEPPVQAKTEHGSTAAPANLQSRLDTTKGGGSPLPAVTRSQMEKAFGADFGSVRVHTGSDAAGLSKDLNAQAFTHGSDVYFNEGKYRPETTEGKRLLGHELVHVVQQGGGTKSNNSSTIQLTPQQRSSLDTQWYVEMEPASSIVPIGTEVTFRLRNSTNLTYAVWEEENGANGPVIGVRVRGGATQTWRPRFPVYPITLRRTFSRPGHVEVFFQGRPLRAAGPQTQPMALTITGSAIYVSVEIDIVEHLTRTSVEAEPSQATYREDINRLEDPNASEPEIAQAFQRVAVRRGIDIVNRNKQEAWDLLQLYTQGVSGRSATQAMEELRSVVRFYSQLDAQISRLRHSWEGLRVAQRSGVEIRNSEQLRNFIDEKIREINLVKASLIDAFPSIALSVGGGPRATMVRHGRIDQAQRALQSLLQQVLNDCDTTRRGLATEDLHIFDVTRVVADVRQTLGIDADPRKRRAIDEAIRRHHRSSLARSLGLAGASLLLLLVPGVGPYLAAAVGLTMAGISWERAGDLLTASGAGVRQGIVSRGEAGVAVFWASIDTILAGLDVATAVRPLTRIAPHIAAETERLVPVAQIAGRRVAPRSVTAMPEVATAGGEGGAFLMSADDLTQFCARLFRRPVSPMRGAVHYYENTDEFVDAVIAEYRRARMTISRERASLVAGFHVGGHIHIRPGAGLLTVIHESIHRVAYETFPMGSQLLGRYLNEGITERITRSLLGPRAAQHGYDQNVAFVMNLERHIGQSTVQNAVLHGRYQDLRNAVRQALSGSEARTFEFFTLLRRGDDESIRQASQILVSMSQRGT